jgi:hypothetical protein
MKYQCDDCAKTGDVKELVIKMGGLICPSCRVIIYKPYVDDIYFKELERRRKEAEKDDEK